MADIDAADELELLAGGDVHIKSEFDLTENDLLGDDECLDEADTNGSVKGEDVDLYDAAIAPSGGDKQEVPKRVSTLTTTSVSNTSNVSASNYSTNSSSASTDKKFCCYVGSMTWWTTDADLMLHFSSIGVNDVIEMKFFENRLNGQSKGYALCIFASDQSVRTLTEKLPQRPIHGSSVCVLPYTKQSLARLEEAVAKLQTRPDPKVPKKEDNCLNMGTIRIGAGGPSAPTPLMMANPQGNMMMRPGMMGGPQPMMNRSQPNAPLPLMINGQPAMAPIMRPMGGPMVPQGMMGGMQQQMNLPPGAPRPLMGPPGTTPMMGGPQPLMQPMQNPQGMRPMQFGQPGPQPLMQQQIRAPGTMGGMPPHSHMPPGAHVNPQVFPGMQPPGGGMGAMSDAEFEEIMNRNRTVSSSAISRAVADASAGDSKAAIETLLTAISLIKQSRVSHDDRCRLLVGSLQDTLNAVEAKSHGGRSKHRDRDRSRSRSRDRERKRRRRSSRSNSRSRSRSPRHRSSRHY